MGRTKIRIQPGLAKRLATTVIHDQIERITAEVEREAQDRAPDAKTWVSENTPTTRLSHRHAHGQTIPDNVPYRVGALDASQENSSSVHLAARPRDPRLPLAERINCGCQSVTLPGAIAAMTRSTPTLVHGTRVTASVESVFDRIAESEFGSSGEPGAHFLSLAAATVVAAHQ
ncbi:hypothetical protein [Nonomuraea dietziae]|uniref:hypothetical protein n=1 Tax=Nonomuraea dietziae TaxID=65515 RepID=UPI0033E9C4E4